MSSILQRAPSSPIRAALLAVATAVVLLLVAATADARSLRIVNPGHASKITGKAEIKLAGVGAARSVTLHIDGKRRARDSRRPWRFGRRGVVSAAKLGRGRHRVTVKARYGARAVRKASIVVMARPRADRTPVVKSGRDRVAPTVAWVAPTAGAEVEPFIEGDACRVGATDDRGVEQVDFYADGEHFDRASSAPWTCELDTGELGPGRHYLNAVARDRAGNTGSAKVAIDVPEGLPATEGASEKPLGLHWMDFEVGDLSQWDMIQRVAPDRIRIVQAPVREGKYAARFEVRPGDNIGDTSPRAELGRYMEEPEGAERYYRWYTYWDPSFPTAPADDFVTFTQWRATDESGSFTSFMVWGDRIELRRDGTRWSTPLVKGVWHEFVYHVKWSPDPSVGFIELRYDGQIVLPKTHTRTMSGTPGHAVTNYMKQGLYQEDGRPTGVLYHDGLVAGDSLAAVSGG